MSAIDTSYYDSAVEEAVSLLSLYIDGTEHTPRHTIDEIIEALTEVEVQAMELRGYFLRARAEFPIEEASRDA